MADTDIATAAMDFPIAGDGMMNLFNVQTPLNELENIRVRAAPTSSHSNNGECHYASLPY